MEFDFTALLLGLPAAFALGWLASRLDLRQMRVENRQSPKAYFRGLNFLLNEQQDQAIDAFIEAVQNDPDTSELHFALGNLFRRRGEYDRAVRVHEHLLARGDLKQSERDRAQHALALDFLKAGLLDRAEAALQRLEGTAYEQEARLALLAIYERSRDWSQAREVAARLDTHSHGSFGPRQAHYLCEQAQACVGAGEIEQALSLLEQARGLAPQMPRPLLEHAKLLQQNGQTQAAFEALLELHQQAPQALPLAAALLAKLALQTGRQEQARQLLMQAQQAQPSIDLVQAIAELETDASAARQWYVRHLEREPSLVAAGKWLAGEALAQPQHHSVVQRAIDRASGPLMRYRCAACGFEAKQHFWHCPGCQAWDSYPARRVEEL
jgi:lipopolysaccharide biosynthesis regulator YciM